MARLRIALVPLTLLWLSLPAAVATGGVFAALLGMQAAASSLVCTCAHGPEHGACPMHKAPDSAAACRLQGVQSVFGTAVVAVLGPLAPPQARFVAAILDRSSGTRMADTRIPADLTAPPDAPPPRG